MGIELKAPKSELELDHNKLIHDFVKNVAIAQAMEPPAEEKKEEIKEVKEETKDVVEDKEERSPEISKLIKKWNDEVAAIRKELSLEDLIFNGKVNSTIDLFGGLLTVTFQNIDYETASVIWEQAYTDQKNATTATFQHYHSLLLLSESVQKFGNKKDGIVVLPKARSEKFDYLKKLDVHVINKLIDKYNQFDTAVKLLTSEEDGENIIDKLKK